MKTYAKVEFVVNDEKIFITNFYPSLEPFDETKLSLPVQELQEESKKLEDKLSETKNIEDVVKEENDNIKIKEVEDVDFLYETYISENETKEKELEESSSILNKIKSVSESVGLKQVFLKIYNKLQDRIELSDLKPLVENIDKADSYQILDALNKIAERLE